MQYVHGYNEGENIRLQNQASTLVDLVHSDTHYPAGSRNRLAQGVLCWRRQRVR